jgi:hypothetical protein
MGAFHRWQSWESGAHGHAYLIWDFQYPPLKLVVMGVFHRWRSWESGAHGHAYLIWDFQYPPLKLLIPNASIKVAHSKCRHNQVCKTPYFKAKYLLHFFTKHSI